MLISLRALKGRTICSFRFSRERGLNFCVRSTALREIQTDSDTDIETERRARSENANVWRWHLHVNLDPPSAASPTCASSTTVSKRPKNEGDPSLLSVPGNVTSSSSG